MPPVFAFTNTQPSGYSQAEAMQAAEILGVQDQVNRLLAAQNAGTTQSKDTIVLKGLILRKILRGILEVRRACNKIDLELAYTYDIMQKEQRHQQFIFSLFNLAIFAQLSTFYTLEPWVRIHKQFVTSAIFTTTSGSLGTGLATLSKLYGHMAKASHVSPPEALNGVVDGWPVNTKNLAPLVEKFLDSKPEGSDLTRREIIFALWKKRYHVDASDEKNLYALEGKNRVSLRYLSNRILLLWSIHTFVQDFDRELLSLLQLIKGSSVDTSESAPTPAVHFKSGETEAVRLLNIRSQVNELISLHNSNSKRRQELELFVLEKTLEGAAEIQVAADKVDEELNYNYDVVLSSLLASRAKWQQWIYNLNFLQSGIMGIVAGRLYLSGFSRAGDRQFVISGGIGTGLTTLSILGMHGFWRKVDTEPNSLAEVLDLHPPSEYRFSPFVSSYLNSVPPDSTTGQTRREALNDAWKKAKVSTTDITKLKNRQALADMPPHLYDTIKIATNRNVLLQSLKKELEGFQNEALDVLQATE